MLEPLSFQWLIPSAIDLPRLLRLYPPRFGYKIDYFYHLLHTICDLIDYLDIEDTRKWVSLQAKQLQAFNDNYTNYVKWLQDRGILEVNPSYLKNKYCMGYRIASTYYQGEPIAIPISDDWIIRQKVIKLKQAKRKQLKQTEKGYHYLTRWYNENLTIDKPWALEEVDRLYPKNQVVFFHKGKWRSIKKARLKALRAVERIANGDFYYSVDDTIGRLHTNLTNLKKDLRSGIRYRGKRLVNLDIANSQPLLSGMLLKPAFYGLEGGKFSDPIVPTHPNTPYKPNPATNNINLHNNKPHKQIKSKLKPVQNNPNSPTYNIHHIPTLQPYIQTTKHTLNKVIKQLSTYIMLGVSPENQAGREFQQYLELVQSGRFYEQMHDLLYPGEPFDRARVKGTAFVLFFAHNRLGPKERALKRPFATKFPTVAEVFKILKRPNKRVLSHILQRTESKLMIETVTRRIAAEHPEIPLFPIHDSLATYPEHADYVEGVLKEEIARLTGLAANIRREPW